MKGAGVVSSHSTGSNTKQPLCYRNPDRQRNERIEAWKALTPDWRERMSAANRVVPITLPKLKFMGDE